EKGHGVAVDRGSGATSVSRLDSAAVQADRAGVEQDTASRMSRLAATARDIDMMSSRWIGSAAALVGLVVMMSAWPAAPPAAQQGPPGSVQIDSDDIGGVVTGKNGPEAGVWVIAETTELGTRFAKIVVTDD